MSSPDSSPTQSVADSPTPPSLILYGVLVIASVGLIAIAFGPVSQDWSGILQNLATEIFGAVLILILVERRLRASEISQLRGLTRRTHHTLLSIIRPDIRFALAYTRIVEQHLESVTSAVYLVRPRLGGLLDEHPNGFILLSPPGGGKSTLVRQIVARQANLVIDAPAEAAVPVLVQMYHWMEGGPIENLKRAIRQYYPISERTFRKLLKRGRLLCVFDGLDEFADQNHAARELEHFRLAYPYVPMIVTTRPYVTTHQLNLPTVEIPPLSNEEARALREILSELESK